MEILCMKVLLNDGLEKEGLMLFQQAGIETDTKKRDLNSLISDVSQFDALIVRSATKVTREVIEAGAKGKLKIVGRSGVGYDNIDVEAANETGVIVKISKSPSVPSGLEVYAIVPFRLARPLVLNTASLPVA